MRRFILGMCAILVAGSGLMVAEAAGGKPRRETPILDVQEPVYAGTNVHFRIYGYKFLPGETVIVYVPGRALMETVVADASGNFTYDTIGGLTVHLGISNTMAAMVKVGRKWETVAYDTFVGE